MSSYPNGSFEFMKYQTDPKGGFAPFSQKMAQTTRTIVNRKNDRFFIYLNATIKGTIRARIGQKNEAMLTISKLK